MIAELLTNRLRAELDQMNGARTDGDRDGSRGELRTVGRLSRGAGVEGVERRRDQRAVTPGAGQFLEILRLRARRRQPAA